MLSIHDLVEINAGDTFLFDEEKIIGNQKIQVQVLMKL